MTLPICCMGGGMEGPGDTAIAERNAIFGSSFLFIHLTVV